MEPNTKDYLARLEDEKEQLREEMHGSAKSETN
jgi:hypothetical protein